MRKFIFTLIVILLSFGIASVNAQVRTNTQTNENKEKLLKLADRFHQEFLVKRAEVERVAQEKGWLIREETEEVVWEIQYIDEYGMPQSYITSNLNAARTVNTDDLWTGGSSGLNLDGTNYLIGEWDGGGVLTTHQEFNPGARVTQMDSPGSTHYHSTHVAGTLIAEGQSPTAHGMAPEALLNAYDWTDDDTEMATAASNNLTLSNHSYGWNRGWVYNSSNGYYYWYGNTSISTTEDYLFGFYDASSQDWDQIAYDAPHYLIVKAAMNDRSDDWNSGHYVWGGTSWVWSTAARDPDGGTDGYDCIDQHGVPKNILTVGAVNDITGGWTSPSDVVMTSFSSWGPTDDGRIKPDIVGNGWNLYSCSNSSNSSYLTLPGTSMAAPNVAGTLALLQDYYQSLRYPYENGYGTMNASTIKGLAINTANEAGTSNGPDYEFGWGLLNATGAADLITADDLEEGLIVEGVILDGQNIDYTYYCDGTTDVRVTLCWTDPPGTPPAASLNPTTGMLVHDLDVYVINASSIYYYPWRLNPTSPSSPATNTSYNYRDNVERTDIYSPAAGYYTIRIEEFSVLPAEGQAYSLIISGLETEPSLQSYCDAYSQYYYNYEQIKNVTIGGIDNTTGRSPGGYGNYSGLIGDINKGSSQSISMEIQGFSGDLATAWVDWNQDGDFTDSGEAFSLGSGPGPVYTSTITAPSTALSGYTTMRVRLTYSTTPTACGYSAYGETEDYALYVVGTPGLWAGTISTNWHTAGNWDDGNIPTSTVDVTIPSGTPYQPTISSSTHANCRNLEILSGATLTQTGTTYLHVYDSFNSDAGTFTQSSGSTYLYFNGSTNTSWDDDNEDDTYRYVRVDKANSSNYVYMWQDMTVGVNFEIREGILQMDSNYDWILTINGTGSNAFEVEDGGTVKLVNSQEIDVAGGVEFEDGSQAGVTGGTIKCGGTFQVDANTLYNIQFTGGTVEMDGTGTQYIDDQDGNTEFYDLNINKSAGTCYLINGDLVVNNELTITAGSFTLNGYEATVAHDCHVYGTLNMINATDVLNIGTNDYDNFEFYDGSTGNLTNGSVYLASWVRAMGNSSLVATTANTIYFTGSNSSAGLRVDNTNSSFGNIDVNKSSGYLYIFSLSSDPIIVNGDFAIHAGNRMDMQDFTMIIHGVLTDNATSTIYVYNGPVKSENSELATGEEKAKVTNGDGAKGADLEIDNDFTLNGLLDVADGDVLLHGDFHIASTGTLDITTGTVIADQAYKGGKAWQYLYGTINLTNGLFEISHNSMYFSSTSVNNISGGTVRCGFTFHAIDAGVFQPTDGIVELTGDGYPRIECNNGNYFYNLLIDRSEGIDLWTDIEIENDFQINSGPLRTFDVYTNQWDINIGGDWTNNGGDAAFDEGTGRVVFNGPGPEMQYFLTSETFNVLENAAVNAIRINSASVDVTCNSYDWTSSGISVVGGSFTALDLADGGLFGSFWALTGSEIILYQDASSYIDLVGTLYVPTTGLIEVHGGQDESFWGSGDNVTVGSSGTLDFVDWGITIWDGGTFNEVITGGTIRTGGHFTCYRTDFIPTGGTFEFYGGTDANISVASGSTFYDVLINKSGGDKSVVQYEDRDGTPMESTKANGTTLITDVDVTNDLNVNAGSLTIGANTLTIDGDCNINALMDVGASGNVLNHGLFELGATGTLTITGGSFVNDHPYGTDAWQNMYGTFNLSAGLFEIMYNSIDLESTFVDNVTGGTMRTGTAFRALTAGTFEPSGGNVEFTGNSVSPGSYIYCNAGNYFNDFDLNSSVYYVLNTDVEVRGDVTIDNGLLNFNSISTGSHDLSCLGDVNINSGGSMSIGENSTLKLDNLSELTVASGGEIQIVGTAGNEAMVTHISTGTYKFWVYGTIGAEYAVFEYMNGNGINVRDVGTVDPAYTFNNCTFQNGAPSPSTLFTLHQDQTFTCNNAHFENTFGNTQYNVWKYEDDGNFTFANATGDFAGPEYEYDPYIPDHVHWTDMEVELDLEVMLEGPFNGAGMNTDLNTLGLIPLNQPFNSIPTADWYYTGTESVGSVPPNVVDWVLVKIKDATDAASSSTAPIVAVQAAFLLNDGSIVDLNGSSNLNFPGISYSSGLFPVIWQRNHLGVISSDKMTRSGGIYTYDFTQAGSAYSNTNPGEKLLGGSIWGMFSGDGSGGGSLNDYDITFWKTDAGTQGYHPGDFNLDSQVENMDKNDFCVENFGNESQIPGSKNNDN